MPQRKSRKILLYIFLFLIIGTLNNKNLNNKLEYENEIIVFGLDEKNNQEIANNLKLLQLGNLFFLDKNKIEEIVKSNGLVEKFSVFKEYPSSLKI